MNVVRLLIALCLAMSAQAFTITAPAASAVAAAPVRASEITMGRGDKRTVKGKRKAKSFGVHRPKNAELRKHSAEGKSSE